MPSGDICGARVRTIVELSSFQNLKLEDFFRISSGCVRDGQPPGELGMIGAL
jgi:hypothetical protein